MAALLLKYDLLLVRRSFADAFARRRDRLLLGLVALFALLWLRDSATRSALSLPPDAAMLALIAGPAAYGWNSAALRRLAWFREASVLALEALPPSARRSYLAFVQLPLLALLIGAGLFLGSSTGEPLRVATMAILSYGAGLAVAAATGERIARPATMTRTGGQGRDTSRSGAFQALLAVQAFGAGRPARVASLLVTGSASATLVGCWLAALQPVAVRSAAALAPSVLLLVATARNAPQVVSLLAFAGYPPRSVAGFVCALPAANLAAVSIALLLVWPEGWPGLLAALLLLHLLAALIATARAWLSPGRTSRRVDLQVQLEILALLLIAGLFAPLAPLTAAWRLRRLHRHYSRSRWIQS